MDPLSLLGYALWTMLAVLAWVVAQRELAHRWVAAYLTWMALSDFLSLGLTSLRHGAPKPYEGMARVAFHADELIALSWNFLFLALCMHYFLRRRPWIALGAWAATFALCLDYPLVSRDVLAWVYRATALVTFGASWACILWGMLRRRDVEPGLAHLVLILLASADVTMNVSLVAGNFFSKWPLVRLTNILVLVACIVVHIRKLCMPRRVEALP